MSRPRRAISESRCCAGSDIVAPLGKDAYLLVAGCATAFKPPHSVSALPRACPGLAVSVLNLSDSSHECIHFLHSNAEATVLSPNCVRIRLPCGTAALCARKNNPARSTQDICILVYFQPFQGTARLANISYTR